MYKKIMVPLDGSPLAECVLPHVEAIAKGCSTGDIVLVSAVETVAVDAHWTDLVPVVKDTQSVDKQNKSAAEAYLKKVTGRMKSSGLNVRSEAIVGKSAADLLADYAVKNSVDLIIIATHGRSGISRWVMGSVAQKLSQSACVPVLLVRGPGCKVQA